MIPDTSNFKQKLFETVPLHDDVESAKVPEPQPGTQAQAKQIFSTFGTIRKVIFLQWALIALVTFFLWMILFALVGLNGSQTCTLSAAPQSTGLTATTPQQPEQSVKLLMFGFKYQPEDDQPSSGNDNRVNTGNQDSPWWLSQGPYHESNPTPEADSTTAEEASEADLQEMLHLSQGSFPLVSERKTNSVGPNQPENQDPESFTPEESLILQRLSELFFASLFRELEQPMEQQQRTNDYNMVSQTSQAAATEGSVSRTSISDDDGSIVMQILPEQDTVPSVFVSPKDDKRHWLGALQACWNKKMSLVSIEDPMENQEIVQNIMNELADTPGSDEDFWTAGTNLWADNPSEFYWATTGQKFNYTFWHDNNPSSPKAPNQNCVQITRSLASSTSGSWMWNDYGCHYKFRYICESPRRNGL